MNPTSHGAPAPGRGFPGGAKSVAWMLLAALLCLGFILLGNWQVRRLHWKLGLIHDVATRVHAAPTAAPGPGQWQQVRDGRLDYLHVTLRGHFLPGAQTLVHGSSEQGYGYWVLAPLRTDRGFVVLVNRGYVPAELPGTPAFAQARPPAGEVALTGLLRRSEPGGGFLRRNRPDSGQWYSRDVAAIAAKNGLAGANVAPYFVDADASTSAGAWPAGGLTKTRFPNSHLGYAITWYLMALGVVLGGWLAMRHARRAGPHPRP